MGKGKDSGTVEMSLRLDNDVVAWLDRIAKGAATERGTVCAVLLSIHVERVLGERGVPVAQALAPAAEGHVTTKREPDAIVQTKAPAAKPDTWPTIQDAAAALGLNASTVWRHVSEGTVKSRKEDGRTFVSMASLARAGIKPRAKRAKKVTKRKRK